MKKITSILLLLFVASFVLANAVVTEWKAEPQHNKIILQWKTSSEENVNKFVVERSTDNSHFIDIGEIAARGPGYLYKYEDNELGIINSIFYYRLRIVNLDNSFQRTDVLTVIPNISSISRTWGSIKALFR
jgi:hypothetical protein